MRRRLLNGAVIIVLMVVAVAALNMFMPLEQVGRVLADAEMEYVAVAGALVFLGMVINTYALLSLLGTSDASLPFLGVFLTTLKSRFMTNTVPSMGIAGLAVLDRHFRREGIDASVSKRVLVLKNMASGIAMLLVVVAGLASVAISTSSLEALLVPTFLTVLVVVGILYAFYLVTAVERLRGIVRTVEGIGGRLARPAGPRMRKLVKDIVESVRYARRNKQVLIIPVLYNLVSVVITSLSVYALFRSLGLSVSIGSVIIGYITALAIGSVSMLPGGVGAFEASMAASYRGVGLELEAIAAVVLLFRLMSFWIPTAIGGILIKKELGEIKDHIRTFIS